MDTYRFTWKNIEDEYENFIQNDYKIITCADYVDVKNKYDGKLLINRVDVDFSIKKVERLLNIFDKLKIKATFFVRLHAPEYNPFSFEGYKIIKKMIKSGHELGYHSEVIDESIIWNEEPINCLVRDLKVLNKIFDYQIKGVASHGGNTGFNNLDFWHNNKPKDFNLLYEAYDKEKEFNLFDNSFYISDSEWTQWKCYDKGKLLKDDTRSPKEHLLDQHKLIYFLIHSDTYYDEHFYE